MFLEILILLTAYFLVRGYMWYVHRKERMKWFEKRGIRGPKPDLFYGNWKQLRSKENNNEIINEWINEYGSVFGYFVGKQPYLVVSDLDLIQKIFIVNNKSFRDRPKMLIDSKPLNHCLLALTGETWKNVRKIVSPTFSQHKVNATAIKDLVEQCVDQLISEIDKENKGNHFTVDVLDKIQAFTLDVISKTALEIETDVYEKNNELMNAVRDFFENAWNPVVETVLLVDLLKPIVEFIAKFITMGKMTDMVVKHLTNKVNHIVTGQTDNKKNFLRSMITHCANGDITADEFIANLFLIILAGYETTANGITFLLYLLAENKDIQRTLREDIEKNGQDSEYIEMVWMETLRVYPPVTLFVTREASEDVLIDGVYIEKGTNVLIPVWYIHRNEDIWKDALTFDPQRFAAKNRKSMHPSAFLPFGLGSRICIGVNLAIVEVKSFLCKLLKKYEIDICDQTQRPLLLKTPTVIINPSTPVYLKFTPLTTTKGD